MTVEEAKMLIDKWQNMLDTEYNYLELQQVAYAACEAVEKLCESQKNDFFVRCTNRKDEIDDVNRGVKIISLNHVDGTEEKGMSVADGLHYSMHGFKYYYFVRGDVIGYGSDGEPVLVNVKAISKLMPVKNIDNRKEYDHLNSIAKKLGISYGAMIRLKYGKNDVFLGGLAMAKVENLGYVK